MTTARILVRHLGSGGIGFDNYARAWNISAEIAEELPISLDNGDIR